MKRVLELLLPVVFLLCLAALLAAASPTSQLTSVQAWVVGPCLN